MVSQNTKLSVENGVFKTSSNNVATSRDPWSYNFSKEEITKNMKRQMDYCNKLDLRKPNLDKIEHDPKHVRWSDDLLQRLKKEKPIFDKKKIRIALYRPFIKQFLYFDKTFNHRVSLYPKILPNQESENLIISITSKASVGKFSALISNVTCDVQVLFNSLSFPLYIYETSKERKENITDLTLQEYREFYNDGKINKKDIFYYVYALLHHPKYCEKYANNLSKETPYIPMAPKFWEYVEAGKNLAKLHINYEKCKKYDLGPPKNKKFGKLLKTSFGRKTDNDKKITNQSEIWINGILVFDNIPKINYHVNGRTPLEWVVDRYKVRVDKESGIVNDPGDVDVVSIIERAVYVGVESDKIIQGLPEEFEPKDWSPRKTGLDKFG